MFDKITEMTKLAQEAKKIQEKHDTYQREQLELLRVISNKLSEVVELLKSKPR